MKRKILIISGLLTSLSFSQEIEEVIVQGNKYLSDEVIKGLIQIKEGSAYSTERVREAIRRLFRTGLFKKIEVYQEDEDKDGKYELIFKVEDLPVIYKIEFEGNDEIEDDELKEFLGIETELGEVEVEESIQTFTSSPAIEERLAIMKRLKLGRILTFKEIEELRKRIEEYYRKRGFPEAKVSYKLIPKKGASKLIFHIQEGSKSYVKDIEIEGNKTFGDRKIKGLMELKEKNLLLLRWDAPFSEELLKEDIERIKEFYKSEGFLEVQVEYKVIREGASNKIVINIKEGPRYKLGKVWIRGNKLYAYSELVGDILKKNERKGGYYRREVIDKIKQNIADKYAEIGYLNVQVREEDKVDTRKKVVDVVFRIREGRPVYVNRIEIKGNYETRDYVIRREMRAQEHELAIKKDIERSRTRIMNLGYYQNVIIQPLPRNHEKWDLLVKIKERFTGQFSVGLSYNEITGLAGFIELRKGNFRGTGDIAGISLSYGSQYRNNSISYTKKWFLKRPMDLDTSVFDRRIEYDTYTITRTGISLAISKEFWEYWRYSIGTSFQRVKYSDISDQAVTYIKEQAGTRDVRKFFVSVRRDTRDWYLLPTKGSLFRATASTGLGILGGTEEFYKLELEGSKYFSDTYFDTGFIL
ncbi:outer membrane protein assembly factor BamA, partial [Aquifex sp.]